MANPASTTAAPVDELLREFLPEARAIETGEPPASGRWTLYALLALILSAITWASVSHIDRLVTGRGRLVSPTANLVVRPLEAGILKTLHVRVGQVVHKGEVLATLDATFAGSDTRQLDSRRNSLALQSRRLQRELDGQRGARADGAVASAADAASQAGSQAPSQQQSLQSQLQSERQAAFTARMQQFDGSIARLKAALETNRQDQKTLGQRVATLAELEKMQSDLEASQFVSKAQRLETQAKREEIERDRVMAVNKEQEIHREMAAVEAERQSYARAWRQDAMEKLTAAVQERDEVTEQANKARLRTSLVSLTAQEDAIVLEVGKVAVGAVVRENDPVVVLVPVGKALEVEVEVRPDDIAELRVGDTTRIKIDAYPFQKHGTATGRVLSLSADAFARQGPMGTQDFYYLARVGLESTRLDQLPGPARLLPGMTLSAEMITGRRSVISYFLYPIIRTLDESFRER